MPRSHDPSPVSTPTPPSRSPTAIVARGWFAGLFALLLALSSGCSEELGPETLPVAPVRGRVTDQGRPVSRGWIEFYPVDGAVGNLRSARIAPDGTFFADRVAVGRNLVRLVNMPVESLAVRRILGAFHSPIRRSIPPGGDQTIEVDVVDEFLRYQQSVTAAQGSAAGGRR